MKNMNQQTRGRGVGFRRATDFDDHNKVSNITKKGKYIQAELKSDQECDENVQDSDDKDTPK